MAIQTDMSGPEIDRTLKAFLDVMQAKNNDKLLYIKQGELSCEDGEKLFDVVQIGGES